MDDHTILDFTVPRAKDSSFGIANYNTNNWLVDYLEPNSKRDVAFATFGRKVRELASYKRPVLPHVQSIEEAGYSRSQVEKRIDEAQAGLPVQ